MSYYDDNSPIGFYDDDDIEAAVGTSQLHADDDDAFDALNGDYDDIMDSDELDDMMDADDDLAELGDIPDDDVSIAQEIVRQCQGTLEDGTPKSAISVSLEMVNPETFQKQTIATQAFYKPSVTINKRMDFIEVVLTFATASDTNLKVLHANFEKYGQKLNEITEGAEMVPIMSMTIIPIIGLGSYYIVAHNPVFWALHPEQFGGAANQMKILIRCDDFGFFQTDEVDLSDITAAVMREQEAENEFYAKMEAKEDARREQDIDFDMSMFDEDDDE